MKTNETQILKSFFLSKCKNLPWCYYLSVYTLWILLNSYRKLTKIRTLNFLEEFGIRIHWEISFIFKELFDRKVKQILERFWAFYQSIKEVKRKWSNLTSPNLYELWIIYQYSIQNLLGNPAFQNWFLCTKWHTSSYMSHLINLPKNDPKNTEIHLHMVIVLQPNY